MKNKTKHEVSEDFIKKAHNAACSEWKERIEKEFPEVFNKQSGWYKDSGYPEWLMYFDYENNKLYGFNTSGDWYTQSYIEEYRNVSEYKKATNEEVKNALIKEAKNRGFKEGVRIRSKWIDNRISKEVINAVFKYEHAELLTGSSGFRYTIFESGEWAEVVEEEKTFRMGDKIRIDNDTVYLICRVGYNQVCLVNVDDGNSWSYTLDVENGSKITKKELDAHVGDYKWKLVDKKK